MIAKIPPAAARPDWHTANQEYLAAEFERIAYLLDGATDDEGGTALAAVERRLTRAADEMPETGSIDRVCLAFDLTRFERDIVLCCAASELDAAIAGRLTIVGSVGYLNFGRAIDALTEPHWSALWPTRPLRRFGLIDVAEGWPLTSSPLRVAPRVLYYLAGLEVTGPSTAPPFRTPCPGGLLADGHAPIVAAIGRALVDGPSDQIVQLYGDDRDGQEDVACRAAATAAMDLRALRSDDIPADARERARLAQEWAREATLFGSVLLIHTEPETPHRVVVDFVERVGTPVVAAGRVPTTNLRASVRFAVDRPEPLEQRSLWRAVLGAEADRFADPVDLASSQFRLSAREVEHAGGTLAAADPTTVDLAALVRATRPAGGADDLADLAQPLVPRATWSDLILPEELLDTLREIAAQVRNRTTVQQSWGFGARYQTGLGVGALFTGDSGTGKTLAAEVLAGELGLELVRIDLATVVSKYIGETEKNLERIFRAADRSGAILLFDEADALFGKRSDIRDSHDRYANIEVSYLLQRMETHRGLAVLTTNARASLDRAFQRRLRFVLQFPFPDEAKREQIWRVAIPVDAPTKGVDFGKLARLNVAGGDIRNIALNAAFLAAAAKRPISMAHLRVAARAELTKLGRSPTDSDTRGWL